MDQRRSLSSPAWGFSQCAVRILTKSGCISERCESRAAACPVRYGGIQRARWVNRHTTPLALYNRTGSVTRTPPPPYTTAGYRLPLQQARRLPICGPPVASATMAETVKNTVFPKKNVKSCVDISKDSKVQHLEVDLRYTVYRVYDTPCVTHPAAAIKAGRASHHHRRYKGHGRHDTTASAIQADDRHRYAHHPAAIYGGSPRTLLQRGGNHDAARKGDRPRGRHHDAKERRTLCRK